MILAVLALIGIGQVTLTLPLGAPDLAMRLALDPLGASFLLLLSVAALPSTLCEQIKPLQIVGMVLTVLAADGFTLAFGLLLLGAALSWRVTTFVAVSLIVALAPFGDFAAMRRSPREAWHSAAILVLVLAAVGALLSTSFPRKRGPSPAWISALAGYLLIRCLFDLCGQTQQLWWSVPLLLLGAVIMAAALLCATLADHLHSILSVASLHQFGMAIIAAGVATIARAVDLPSVASLAFEAAWLSLVAYVLCGALLTLVAAAVDTAAGTTRLDRLGGLIHPMPRTAIACLIGLFGTGFLPPGLGFAAFWLLLQSLLAAARASGFGLQLLIGSIVAVTGLSAGLASLASIRVFGVAFLGRPRTPRTAVAEEAPRRTRFTLIALAALIGLLGLLPAFALLPAAGWTNATVRVLTLRSGTETPGYPPVVIAALLVIIAIGAFFALRGRRSRDLQREPAWSGGSAKPPPWLPFGDPTTQYGPIAFIEPLHRMTQRIANEARTHIARWRAVLR
jgi:hydrogenase-4 component B